MSGGTTRGTICCSEVDLAVALAAADSVVIHKSHGASYEWRSVAVTDGPSGFAGDMPNKLDLACARALGHLKFHLLPRRQVVEGDPEH